MDVREKLIEILRKPIFPHELVDPVEAVADYLLDSGVTVQEWIPVNDRLPDGFGEVLVIVSGKPQKNITLDAAYEIAEYDHGEGWIIEMWPEWEDAVVTHWMPLPHPPKGE